MSSDSSSVDFVKLISPAVFSDRCYISGLTSEHASPPRGSHCSAGRRTWHGKNVRVTHDIHSDELVNWIHTAVDLADQPESSLCQERFRNYRRDIQQRVPHAQQHAFLHHFCDGSDGGDCPAPNRKQMSSGDSLRTICDNNRKFSPDKPTATSGGGAKTVKVSDSAQDRVV